MFICFVDWVYERLIQRLNRPLPVKPLFRLAIVAALFTGWYILMTVPPMRLLDATSSDPVDFHVSENSPVCSLARSMEDHRWRLVQCEAEPTACGGFGYRVTLAYDWAYTEAECRVPRKMRRAYSQFVFVADDQPEANRLAARISWKDLDHRAPRWFVHEDPPRTIDMGCIGGFHIYGLTSIAQQEVARARLGTIGGENRLMLLDELLGQSSTDLAYFKTIRLLAQHGSIAVPILEREIGRSEGMRKFALIKSLAGIPGPKSAALLQLLHADAESQHLVAYALCAVPPREDLVDVYLDLVRSDSSASILARAYEAFMHLEPEKAEVAFARMREAPRTICHFAAATRGLRAVQEDPFSPDLENVGSTLRVTRYFLASQIRLHADVDQARNLLLHTDDVEAAITIALEAAAADHSQGLSLKQSPGVDILLALPEAQVIPLLALLASVTTDDASRAFARQVLEYREYQEKNSVAARIARASI